MAERSNAAVLKTVVLYPRDRGFESLFLRQSNQISRASNCATFCFMKIPNQACLTPIQIAGATSTGIVRTAPAPCPSIFFVWGQSS